MSWINSIYWWIIYKNKKGFFIIEPQDEEYDFICTELDKRVTSNFDGKVISEDDLISLKETESFIEFDYNKDSKNRIFFLEKKDYGMVKMLEKDGQIVKPNLDNLKELKKVSNILKIRNWFRLNSPLLYI